MKHPIALLAGLALSASCAFADVKVAWLEIGGAPAERPSELAWLFGNEDEPSLRELVDAIEGEAEAADTKALVIRLKDASLGVTQVQELGKAIRHVRDSGKKVFVFAEALDTSDFLLASYADHVTCQAGGDVSLHGIYMEEMFLGDALAWAGLKANYVQIGDYKGASEQMARGTPSKEWDENINQLLDGLYARTRSTLMEGRKLDAAALDAAMEHLWMSDSGEALKHGVIDAEVDLPAYVDFLAKQLGDKVTIEEIAAGSPGELSGDLKNPLAMLSVLGKSPVHEPKGSAIAVVHIDGAIVDGDSTASMSGGGEVGSRTIRNALEDVLAESKIKGVVVRIDSPGGSATASEIIWQGIRRVAASKPVWVSVGDMAASGGYYCAVAGDRIYVNPSSIVGSIGVVGGKIAMKGLYDKVHVNVVGRSRGPHADLFSSATEWNDEQVNLVRGQMTRTYELFTKRVVAGRPGIELARTAEGRLFTGEKAIELKMADAVGGLDDALSDLGESLKLKEYEVVDYPQPRSLKEVASDLLHSAGGGILGAAPLAMGSAAIDSTVKQVVGDRAFQQLRSPMRALMQMRDGKVLLTSPKVLIFR
jgi:protease IV